MCSVFLVDGIWQGSVAGSWWGWETVYQTWPLQVVHQKDNADKCFRREERTSNTGLHIVRYVYFSPPLHSLPPLRAYTSTVIRVVVRILLFVRIFFFFFYLSNKSMYECTYIYTRQGMKLLTKSIWNLYYYIEVTFNTPTRSGDYCSVCKFTFGLSNGA